MSFTVSRLRLCWPMGLALALSACASLSDAPARVSPPVPAQWQAPLPHEGQLQGLTNWWAQFDDPVLLRLLEHAQDTSPSLQAAAARITQARANQQALEGRTLPSLALDASSTRSYSAIPAGSRPQTLSTVRLDTRWELDLFSAERLAARAALAQAEGAAQLWHDARVSLAAEVARTYVARRTCEALAVSADRVAETAQDSARLVALKARAGLESPAGAAAQDALAADAKARALSQQAECAVLLKSLVVLTGISEPDLTEALKAGAGQVPKPAGLAVSLVPAQWLVQRPDLQAAQLRVQAAWAELGSAQARRWPQLSLTGSIGVGRLRLDGSNYDGKAWSFGPSLSLPIFSGGQISAQIQAAQGRYDEAQAQWQQAVRGAVAEVEQSLLRLDAAERRTQEAHRAAQQRETLWHSAQQQAQAGATSRLDLLEAERGWLASRQALSLQHQERVEAWISLYKALGGAWQSAPAAAAASAASSAE